MELLKIRLDEQGKFIEFCDELEHYVHLGTRVGNNIHIEYDEFKALFEDLIEDEIEDRLIEELDDKIEEELRKRQGKKRKRKRKEK